MDRSSLTPTVITDKNGRVTTVHRKDVLTHLGRATIPAPVAPIFKTDRDAPKYRISRVLATATCSNKLMNEIRSFSDSLEGDDLEAFAVALEHDRPLREEVASVLMEHAQKVPEDSMSRWLRRVRDNNRRLYDDYCIEAELVQGESYRQPSRGSCARTEMAFIRGIEEYERRGYSLTEKQEDDLLTVVNQAYLSAIIHKDMSSLLSSQEDGFLWERSIYLEPDELIGYVMEHPEKVEELLDHLRNPAIQRESELMHVLFSEGSSSLASGTL